MSFRFAIGCGGYHAPKPDSRRVQYVGLPKYSDDDSVCIILCKPRSIPKQFSPKISILRKHPKPDSKIKTDRRTGEENRNEFLSSITDPATGFQDDLKIRLLGHSQYACDGSLENESFTYGIKDLSTVLLSGYVPPPVRKNEDEDDAGPSPAKKAKTESSLTVSRLKINCVIQTRKRRRSNRRGCKYIPGGIFNVLRCDCSSCCGLKPVNAESDLWNRMDNISIYAVREIVKYMDYDQIKWMCDEDVALSRMLAKERYGVADAEDRTKYPDAESVWTVLRNSSAVEMRFHGDEALWMCSLDSKCKPRYLYGMCRRYPVKEGTYRWRKVATMTTVKYDSSRCGCFTCYMSLLRLKKAMGDHQLSILANESRCKIFALKGSEDIEIDRDISSVFIDDNKSPNKFANVINAWTDDASHRWLNDVVTQGDQDLSELIANFNTLFFKDPVKFFGVKKFVHLVDNETIAIMSCKDCEVLGYAAVEKVCRFRVPVNDTSRIVGLNLIPDLVTDEVKRASDFVRHIYNHDIRYTIESLKVDVKNIRTALNGYSRDREELERTLSTKTEKINRLSELGRLGPCMESTSIRTDVLNDDRLHVHETFYGDFEFCTRYMIEPLDSVRTSGGGTKKTKKENLKFLLDENICGENSCNINVIDKDALECELQTNRRSFVDIV